MGFSRCVCGYGRVLGTAIGSGTGAGIREEERKQKLDSMYKNICSLEAAKQSLSPQPKKKRKTIRPRIHPRPHISLSGMGPTAYAQ